MISQRAIGILGRIRNHTTNFRNLFNSHGIKVSIMVFITYKQLTRVIHPCAVATTLALVITSTNITDST